MRWAVSKRDSLLSATVGSVWVLWRSVKMRLVGHQVTRNFTILVLADAGCGIILGGTTQLDI